MARTACPRVDPSRSNGPLQYVHSLRALAHMGTSRASLRSSAYGAPAERDHPISRLTSCCLHHQFLQKTGARIGVSERTGQSSPHQLHWWSGRRELNSRPLLGRQRLYRLSYARMADGAGVEPARPEGLDALAPRCLTARPTIPICRIAWHPRSESNTRPAV